MVMANEKFLTEFITNADEAIELRHIIDSNANLSLHRSQSTAHQSFEQHHTAEQYRLLLLLFH